MYKGSELLYSRVFFRVSVFSYLGLDWRLKFIGSFLCPLFLKVWLNGSHFRKTTIFEFFGNFPKPFPYHLSLFLMFQNFWLNEKPPTFYSKHFCSFYFFSIKMFLSYGAFYLHVSYLSSLDYFTISVGRRWRAIQLKAKHPLHCLQWFAPFFVCGVTKALVHTVIACSPRNSGTGSLLCYTTPSKSSSAGTTPSRDPKCSLWKS